MMYQVIIMFLLVMIGGCVAGPPYLTEDQEKRLPLIEIYESKPANNEYVVIGEVKGADCTGPYGSRLYGKKELAIDYIKRKALVMKGSVLI